MFSGVAFWQSPTPAQVAGLTYGRFVTGRLSGTLQRAAWSNDGISFTVATTPNSYSYLGSDFSPDLGLYVLVGSDAQTNNIMSSTNGVTWTARSKPDNVGVRGVRWCPTWSKFYAVGNTKIYESVDGINWTISYTFSSGKLSANYNPVFADTGTQSIFSTTMYTGTSPNFRPWVCYTTDGSTFTEYQVSTTQISTAITLGYSKSLNRFLITDQSGVNNIFETQNIGSTWSFYTQNAPNASGGPYALALERSDSEGFFVRGFGAQTNTTPIYRSSTGLSGSWTASTFPSTGYSFWNIKYAPEIDTWCAPQIAVTTGYTSVDGITWTSRTYPSDMRTVTWGPGVRTNGYKQGAGIT